jgi:DNA-binding GntR family transcriptional regulator
MAEPTLDPIEQTPLRVQIADRLRSAIVTGRMRPGDTITAQCESSARARGDPGPGE